MSKNTISKSWLCLPKLCNKSGVWRLFPFRVPVNVQECVFSWVRYQVWLLLYISTQKVLKIFKTVFFHYLTLLVFCVIPCMSHISCLNLTKSCGCALNVYRKSATALPGARRLQVSMTRSKSMETPGPTSSRVSHRCL